MKKKKQKRKKRKDIISWLNGSAIKLVFAKQTILQKGDLLNKAARNIVT